ncbi:MAG TPA: class I SAM-dependent rRNA methyltransferase [Candidatus Binataceae bacterium]|nr:class I SAM-dependent rRNA methyltransferase [Candidatus Binataceae bacterium]
MTIAGRIFLRAGRDRTVRSGNPWIFSQAIGRAEPPSLTPGDWVEVYDIGGDFLGIGYINPQTTIAIRMLTFDRAPAADEIIACRLQRAAELRMRIIPAGTDCYRLLNGDGDALSGAVIDRYGDVAVLQLLTAGADHMRDAIVAEIQKLIAPKSIIERSQGAVRRQEGLGDRLVHLAGEPVSETIVNENGVSVLVNFDHGQKTGAFLDQRDNRFYLRSFARGLRVLDACCYSGAFTLNALAGGAAHVTAIDTSARALGWAQRNLELNGHGADRVNLLEGDAALFLATTSERFDLIILDPPPFARGLKDAARAAHLYTDFNAYAMRALAPGGALMTFSCSAHFHGEDFVRAVRIAHAKAGRKMRILAHLGPAPDHPVLLGHPEGEYLSGLMLADLA